MQVDRIGRWLAAAALFAAAGCDTGPRLVPVSGVVSIDSKPYADAVVVFQPIATSPSQDPGPGSSAFTDANGRFELKTKEGDVGAVAGKHLIRIQTKGDDIVIVDPTRGSSDSAPLPRRGKVDPIPRSWNANSTHEFEVPAAGTDQANFNIETKPGS